ncbi:MAG: ester cyclase [Acidobacteria bacterium]|nr:ester cyclase [Acidobacteriota bacterium]
MPAQENKAIFLRFIEELRRGNIGIVDEVCSPNFRFYSPNSPNFPRGLEGARMLASRGKDSAVEAKIEDIICEDDRVAVRWTFTGIYRGEPQPGYPKPGQKITFGSMSFYRFVNDKIEEDWGLDVVSPTDDPWS